MMTNVKRVYLKISSMKTGLVLLAVIALASALGSTIMPGVLFRTLLFKFLFALITLNMLLCTLNRLIRLKTSLFKGYGYPHPLGFVRQLGILLLHVGIILVIAGAGVFLVLGQSVMLTLSEGETADISKLINVGKPFSMHLEQFKMEFNEDGSPSQYYSQIQIGEGNETKENTVISVNHPLDYAGIKAYQQSYGNKVRIKVTDPTQKATESSLNDGQSLSIPGTEMTVKVYRYIPNFDPDYGMTSKTIRPDNPRVIFSVYEKDKMLGVGTAKIGESIELDKGIHLVFTGVEPYTVLKLKSDPGLPVTAGGGILFMLGVSMALISVGGLPKKNPDQHSPDREDTVMEIREEPEVKGELE